MGECGGRERTHEESSLEPEQQSRPTSGRNNIAWFVANSPPLPVFRREISETSFNRENVLNVPLSGVDEFNSVPIELAENEGVNDGESEDHAHVTLIQPKLEWTLFQVWNNLAFATCSAPYRVHFDTQGGKYILKCSRIQQFFFGMQNVAALASTVARWRTFLAILNGPPNPLKYVKFAGLTVKCLAQFFHFKTVTFDMDDILRLHTLAKKYDAVIINNFKIEMGKEKTTLYLFIYSLYLFGYCSISPLLMTYSRYQNWEWGVAEIIQTFACFTRQVYTWAQRKDCPAALIFLTDIPFEEYFYGGLGLFTYVSRIILREHTTLMIMTSCLTILQMSWGLKNSTANEVNSIEIINNDTTTSRDDQTRNPPSRFHFLQQSINLISSFIGLLLITPLIDVACDVPKCLNDTFNTRSVMAALLTVHILTIFLALLLGCVSAMQINEMQDRITDEDSEDDGSLPQDIQRFILHIFRVLRKSVGIGYHNLVVLNFPFLFTYFSLVASLVGFTYEAEH